MVEFVGKMPKLSPLDEKDAFDEEAATPPNFKSTPALRDYDADIDEIKNEVHKLTEMMSRLMRSSLQPPSSVFATRSEAAGLSDTRNPLLISSSSEAQPLSAMVRGDPPRGDDVPSTSSDPTTSDDQ
jgi:hypothetical protein